MYNFYIYPNTREEIIKWATSTIGVTDPYMQYHQRHWFTDSHHIYFLGEKDAMLFKLTRA